MQARPAVPAEVISSADVAGVAVYDDKGNKLGKIDHLIIHKSSGRVQSVVLVVNGFFGLGHSHAELPWRSLKYSPMLRAYVVLPDEQA
jgi:uncharacterized protein YrrD